jgi:hypothetical protein
LGQIYGFDPCSSRITLTVLGFGVLWIIVAGLNWKNSAQV